MVTEVECVEVCRVEPGRVGGRGTGDLTGPGKGRDFRNERDGTETSTSGLKNPILQETLHRWGRDRKVEVNQ